MCQTIANHNLLEINEQARKTNTSHHLVFRVMMGDVDHMIHYERTLYTLKASTEIYFKLAQGPFFVD